VIRAGRDIASHATIVGIVQVPGAASRLHCFLRLGRNRWAASGDWLVRQASVNLTPVRATLCRRHDDARNVTSWPCQQPFVSRHGAGAPAAGPSRDACVNRDDLRRRRSGGENDEHRNSACARRVKRERHDNRGWGQVRSFPVGRGMTGLSRGFSEKGCPGASATRSQSQRRASADRPRPAPSHALIHQTVTYGHSPC
jgi:hypothetical protein